MKHVLQAVPSDISVGIEFINADAEDESGTISVRFLIRGQSRDWVFVTSTILEERITKIKRFAPNQLGGKGPGRLLWQLSTTSLIMLGVVASMYWSLVGLNRARPSAALEEAWKSGRVKDPVEAIILVEKMRDQAIAQAIPKSALSNLLLFVGGGMLLSLLALGFLLKYYPVYNFCWGDYLEVFQRKESRRKFVLVAVVVGILVSFVGGVLANLLHRGT